MQEKFKNLPLRIGVGIILLNKDNKVFVAKRLDNPRNYWQMPQGGVDGNEKFLDAALRELEEETSIKNVKLIKEIDGTMTYELPDHLLGIIWKGRYKGQNTVISDTRFINEIKTIRAHGGKIICVKRGELPTQKQMQERGAHRSEWDWLNSDFDFIIENSGTKEQLFENVDNLIVSNEITNPPSKSTDTTQPLTVSTNRFQI